PLEAEGDGRVEGSRGRAHQQGPVEGLASVPVVGELERVIDSERRPARKNRARGRRFARRHDGHPPSIGNPALSHMLLTQISLPSVTGPPRRGAFLDGGVDGAGEPGAPLRARPAEDLLWPDRKSGV